jgi:hypothetical protein
MKERKKRNFPFLIFHPIKHDNFIVEHLRVGNYYVCICTYNNHHHQHDSLKINRNICSIYLWGEMTVKWKVAGCVNEDVSIGYRKSDTSHIKNATQKCLHRIICIPNISHHVYLFTFCRKMDSKATTTTKELFKKEGIKNRNLNFVYSKGRLQTTEAKHVCDVILLCIFDILFFVYVRIRHREFRVMINKSLNRSSLNFL